MDIDLTGQPTFQYSLSFGEFSGNVTLTFAEEGGAPVLGTITIEAAKFRALMNSLETTSSEIPDQMFPSEFDQKTRFLVRDLMSLVEFN